MNCYLLPLSVKSVQKMISQATKKEIDEWCVDRGYEFLHLVHPDLLRMGGLFNHREFNDFIVFPDVNAAFEFKMRWL